MTQALTDVAQPTGGDGTDIRPFRFKASEADLADLRRRVNATKWLNLGLYGNIAFGGVNHFEFSYLNPVIFLPAAQQENGSPDKTTVGFDFKANIAHTVQLYGQLLFNEFVWNQIKNYSDGWWGNKQGLQFGVKYGW